MSPLAITAHTATSALGSGLTAQLAALEGARSGLRPNDISRVPLACWIGRVAGVEEVQLPESLRAWDCRNNRLAWLGLNQDGFLQQVEAARTRYGAARVALLLGTSTASIGATE
ncbi:MAG: beta-ketoacyl-[acyl-carrier-protein] synthase II, partial [Rhodanobacter sp.]